MSETKNAVEPHVAPHAATHVPFTQRLPDPVGMQFAVLVVTVSNFECATCVHKKRKPGVVRSGVVR